MSHENRAVFIGRWVRELSRYVGRSETELLEHGLEAGDFKGEVSLGFEDGSRVFFRYAFCVRRDRDPELVAIFTEHCGYHEYRVGSDDELIISNLCSVRRNDGCSIQ